MSKYNPSGKILTLEGFKKIVGDYTDKSILDYGGNKGNLIPFSQGTIEQQNYTCIDVDKNAIEDGKKEFPKAKFIHYNRFSPMYNNGNFNEPHLQLDQKYDICFSHSIFTHTDLHTFIETISYLKDHAKSLFISFVSTKNHRMKKWVYDKRCNEYNSCVNLDIDCDYFYLVNNDKIYIEENIHNNSYDYFFSFYNPDFIKKTFECDIVTNSDEHMHDFMIIKT